MCGQYILINKLYFFSIWSLITSFRLCITFPRLLQFLQIDVVAVNVRLVEIVRAPQDCCQGSDGSGPHHHHNVIHEENGPTWEIFNISELKLAPQVEHSD